MPSDNVLILGAGFSFDAGIPLLAGFVQRMWEISSRKKATETLSASDVKIFERAMEIRNNLDGYHGRSRFDDRNIEDLLSLLSFNAIGGGVAEKQCLEDMTRAIARTIDLTCKVRHAGFSTNAPASGNPSVYLQFWDSVFKAFHKGHGIPAIITFNYDLVLERSLLDLLVGTHIDDTRSLPFKSLSIKYHVPKITDAKFKTERRSFNVRDREGVYSYKSGVYLILDEGKEAPDIDIEILKLHGSLNFPAQGDGNLLKSFTECVPQPDILPPTFNKLSSRSFDQTWAVAMERLRHAKNIVIVGYSLPETDIYMQYFLKAALGPNLSVNKITVFDPLLFKHGDSCEQMKSRYENCFSDPLKSRMDFCPMWRGFENSRRSDPDPGTTAAFVRILGENPEQLLF